MNDAGAVSNNWIHRWETSHALPFVATIATLGNSQADAQILFTGPSGMSLPAIYNYAAGANWPVVDKSNEYGYFDTVGDVVCKSGFAGGTSCGTLQNRISAVALPWPHNRIFFTQREVAGMTAAKGDSGGPVWGFHLFQAITTATGILSAHNTTDTLTYYSHIDRAYAELAAQGAPFTVLT